MNQLPIASFTQVTTTNTTVTFTNTSTNATSYRWDFGDGSAISTDENPVHEYPVVNASYDAQLIVTNSCSSDTSAVIIRITLVGINELNTNEVMEVYPNPNNGSFTLKTVESGEYSLINLFCHNNSLGGHFIVVVTHHKINAIT